MSVSPDQDRQPEVGRWAGRDPSRADVSCFSSETPVPASLVPLPDLPGPIWPGHQWRAADHGDFWGAHKASASSLEGSDTLKFRFPFEPET